MTPTATTEEVASDPDAWLETSANEPVIMTRDGRPHTVLLADEDFLRMAKRDRRVQRAVDLTDAEIAMIEASEMAPGYEHLNAELDEPPDGSR